MSKEIQFVKNDWDKYVQNNKYLVANFTASWCGPCQAIKPLVDQMYNDPDERYKRIEFVRVDLDTEPMLSSRFKVTSVPTFILLESGKEVKRIQGANVPELTKSLHEFSNKANSDDAAGDRSGNGQNSASSGGNSAPGAAAALTKKFAPYIPKGYELLNNYIYFPQFEALNSVPLYKNDTGDVKDIFRLADGDATSVISDSDSQLLFYVPFTHICKIYSLLVSFKKPGNYKHHETAELDEDELASETQVPSLIKVWANHNSILSFDDADDSNAPHSEKLDVSKYKETDEEVWYEAKVKYVRFQNVQSLNIFLDGEDEDYHTLLDKVVIIGINGESKEQGKLSQLEE